MEVDARIVHAVETLVSDGGGPKDAPPFVLGLCGAQGSGKSTLAALLAARWNTAGRPTAVLSLDDLYRTRAEREALARTMHPLFATRGPPGTHDVALGLAVIDAMKGQAGIALPRFDKATDDREPASAWEHAPAGVGILILEGWCVGARPQQEAELVVPVNALEGEDDAGGIWRRHANAALEHDYQRLWSRIDRLVLLAAPDFAVVQGWRTQQEAGLRASGTAGGMIDSEIGRFIQHYERLTRHILDTMPAYADLVIQLQADRSVGSVQTGRERHGDRHAG